VRAASFSLNAMKSAKPRSQWTMKHSIQKFDLDQEYFFEEGCHIVEISNSAADEDQSIVRARVAVGQQTKWHSLDNTTERYVILQGCGMVEIGNKQATAVSYGDVIIIPAQTRQRIKNTGSEDLIFLAICSPSFQKSNYREQH
jgi:mannose-6-phosphate isomerase-like protein (cupin superfamily)